MSSTNNEPEHSELGLNGIHASRPADQPLMTSGHQPGKLVGNDAIPESHVKVLPPGTAPPESTFTPNTSAESNDSNAANKNTASAADTIGGATSADVHSGIGKPVQGQSSAELRHDGEPGKRNATGLQGVGGSAVPHSQSSKDPVPNKN